MHASTALEQFDVQKNKSDILKIEVVSFDLTWDIQLHAKVWTTQTYAADTQNVFFFLSSNVYANRNTKSISYFQRSTQP